MVFARGTGEDPGLGPTGQAFVDALRGRFGGKSLDVYPVNYPASDQWSTGLDGIRDAGSHVISEAGACPNTKMVLGGYSQGAAVAGFATSPAVPDSVPQDVDPATIPKPLDPALASHVAAVVLFGTPNVRAMNFLGQPNLAIGPLYQSKTIQVCAVEDPVCSDGMNFAAHNTYADDGSVISPARTSLRAACKDRSCSGPRRLRLTASATELAGDTSTVSSRFSSRRTDGWQPTPQRRRLRSQ